MYGVLYSGTNVQNGKQYIGQTTLPEPTDRWLKQHIPAALQGKKHPLSAAIRKYGVESFSWEIIWFASDKVSLDIAEDVFINFFDTLIPNGYNIRGGGSRGKFSEPAKVAHKIIMKEVRNRPEILEHTGLKSREAHARPLTKLKHRSSIKHALNKPGMHEYLSLVITRALADPLVREKLAKATQNSWLIPEIRNKRIEGINNPAAMNRMVDGNLGTKWINNGEKNRKLKKNESLPEGWSYGRFGYIVNPVLMSTLVKCQDSRKHVQRLKKNVLQPRLYLRLRKIVGRQLSLNFRTRSS